MRRPADCHPHRGNAARGLCNACYMKARRDNGLDQIADGPFGKMPDFDSWPDVPRCADADPETFFPDKSGSTRPGKAICATCPVREQCLQHAIDNHERHGIWGGLSEQERRRYIRHRQRSGRRPHVVRNTGGRA